MSLAMYFIVNGDLKMGKGKLAAQVAHAAVELALVGKGNEFFERWLEEGGKKIVVEGFFQDVLDATFWARKRRIPFILIRDAGYTQVPKGSITVVGIGPILEDSEPYLKSFRLL